MLSVTVTALPSVTADAALPGTVRLPTSQLAPTLQKSCLWVLECHRCPGQRQNWACCCW